MTIPVNRLKRISLFHIGLFENAEIVLDTNTILFGTNGVGKTTSLALLTFFATGKRDLLRGGKKGGLDFLDYFFKANNSFIVYEYEKAEHNVLVAVYAKEGMYKLEYKFILMDKKPYNVDDIFNKNSRAEVLNTIDDVCIDSIDVDEKSYLKILYGAEKNKNQLSTYTFSHVRDYRTFINLYYAAFQNISMTSKGIKNIVLEYVYAKNSLGKGSINLEKYSRNIAAFKQNHEAIMEWHKQADTIEKLKEYLQKMKHAKLNQKQILLQMQCESRWYIELEENKKNELSRKSQALESFQRDEMPEKRKKLMDKKSAAYVGVKRLGEKIADLESIHRNYRDDNELLNMIKLYPNYDNWKSKYNRNKKILEALQEKTKTQEEKLVIKKEELKKHYEKTIQNNEKYFETQESFYLNKKVEEYEKIEIKRKKIETLFSKIEPKELEYRTLVDESGNKELEIKKLKQNKFIYQESYEVLQENIKCIQNLLDTLDKETLQLEHLEKGLELDEENFLEVQQQEKERVIKKYNIDSKVLDEKIEHLYKVTRSTETLYAKIEKAGLDTEKYTSILSQEALGSHDFVLDNTASGLQVLDFSLSADTKLFEVGESFEDKIKGLKEEKDRLKKSYKIQDNAFLKEYDNFFTEHRKKVQLLKEKKTSYKDTRLSKKEELSKAQEALAKAQRYWETEQDIRIKRVQNEYNKIEAKRSTLRREINELQRDKNEALAQIEKNVYDEKAAIQKEMIVLEEKNKLALIEYKKAIEQEEQIYKQSLQDAGLDDSQIEQYRTECNTLKFKLDRIDSYRILIEKYQNFLEGDYKELENLQDEYKKKEREYDELVTEVDSTLRDMELLQSKFKNELKDLEEYIKRIEKERKKLNDVLLEHQEILENISPLAQKNEDEKRQTNIEDDTDRLLSELRQVTYTYTNAKSEIEQLIHKRWSQFIAKDIFAFSTDIIENAKTIVAKEESDEIGLFTDNVFQTIKLSIGAIADYHTELQDGYKEVKKAIHRINRDLEDISSTSLIESITLRTQDKLNGIDEEMSRLTNYWEEHAANMQQTLFSTKYNSKHKDEILKRLDAFLEKLDTLSSKEKQLSVGSLFVLQGRIVEKGNDSDWQDNIFDAGSEGTRLLIKVAFIASLFSMALHGSKDEQIPYIVIDEIGKLHNNNVEKVLNYINQKGSYLVAVQPNNAMARFFDKAYFLDDVSTQETRIIEYIRKKKAIKLKGVEYESLTS